MIRVQQEDFDPGAELERLRNRLKGNAGATVSFHRPGARSERWRRNHRYEAGALSRQDLLGHRSGRITTHYSAAELSQLIKAANAVCEKGSNKPELVVLRRPSSA